MKEKWKSIAGFEDIAKVSNTGKIKYFPRKWKTGLGTTRSHKGIITIGNFNSGYYRVNFIRDKTMNTMAVHRLVAAAFNPNPLNLPEVNHLDGNKLNNQI